MPDAGRAACTAALQFAGGCSSLAAWRPVRLAVWRPAGLLGLRSLNDAARAGPDCDRRPLRDAEREPSCSFPTRPDRGPLLSRPHRHICADVFVPTSPPPPPPPAADSKLLCYVAPSRRYSCANGPMDMGGRGLTTCQHASLLALERPSNCCRIRAGTSKPPQHCSSTYSQPNLASCLRPLSVTACSAACLSRCCSSRLFAGPALLHRSSQHLCHGCSPSRLRPPATAS